MCGVPVPFILLSSGIRSEGSIPIVKKFSRAQFSKLRNGINGVGEFRYDTVCSQNFVLIG